MPTQTTPFAATAVLYDRPQREAILAELLKDYYTHHLEDREKLEPETVEEEELRARTAFEALRSLFADRDDFINEDAARIFLEKTTSPTDSRILAQLTLWTEELLARCGARNGQTHHCANNVEELRAAIEVYTIGSNFNDEKACSPSLWPLVRTVKVNLRAAILKHGLVVADLPGLSDTNKIRISQSQRYTRNCAFIFIVAPIARVQTNNQVEKRLVEALAPHGTKKALICTQTDNMTLKVQLRDLIPSPIDEANFNRMTQASASLNIEHTKAGRLKGKARDLLGKYLAGRMQTLSLKKKAFSALRLEALVLMRNKKIIRVMRKRYRELTKDPLPLHIHCVSNSHYALHKAGYDEELFPMTIQSTGIPALRELALSVPAFEKLNVLRHHCEYTLPSLINSMDLWTHQSATKRRVHLRQVILEAHKACLLKPASSRRSLTSRRLGC